MWGLGADFDECYYKPHLQAEGYAKPLIFRPEALLEQVKRWFDKKPRTPFFAYVHFMPPHAPYIAPPDMSSRFVGSDPPNAWRGPYPFDGLETERREQERSVDLAFSINRYDSNYCYADWAVGEVERLLRKAGLLDHTLLIVSADHGEAWGEHGYIGHTRSAWDETIHIPLVMKFPGGNGPRAWLHGLTQTVDMLPTLCDLFLMEYPEGHVQGKSLLPLMAGEVDDVNDYVFARTMGNPPSYAVRSHDWLLILYQGGRLRALYDLRKDPRALRNRIKAEPEKAEEMCAAFRSFAERQLVPPLDYLDPDAPTLEPPPVPAIKPTEDTLKTMRDLGYLQ